MIGCEDPPPRNDLGIYTVSGGALNSAQSNPICVQLHAEKARRKVGDARWSARLSRDNYMQFGGKPQPNELLEMLGDQDLGDNRPLVTVKSPPTMINETQQAVADNK